MHVTLSFSKSQKPHRASAFGSGLPFVRHY
jgi:hypothetical protein